MMTRTTMLFSMLALVALLFTGCAKTPEQRVTGTWGLDVDGTVSHMEGSGDQLEQARAMMESMNMTLTFNADGTMSMSMTLGETRTEEGTWSVKSAEGDTITVETIEAAEGDEEVEPDEVVMNFTGNDTFAATIMNDTLVFNRQ